MREEILHTVYEYENGNIYNEIIENEFIKEFLIVEFTVTNTMIITNTFFTNDLTEEEMSDQNVIFYVEELTQNPDLKSIIENGRVIGDLSSIVPEVL